MGKDQELLQAVKTEDLLTAQRLLQRPRPGKASQYPSIHPPVSVSHTHTHTARHYQVRTVQAKSDVMPFSLNGALCVFV